MNTIKKEEKNMTMKKKKKKASPVRFTRNSFWHTVFVLYVLLSFKSIKTRIKSGELLDKFL